MILFGGPIASMIVSPMRQAGQFSIMTVGDPSMTTPGPCGGMGHGIAQACMLDPPAAAAVIAAALAAAAGRLRRFRRETGGRGGGNGRRRAGRARRRERRGLGDLRRRLQGLERRSVLVLAAASPGPAASGIPFHAGMYPMRTFAGGPPVRTGGTWGGETASPSRAAGP